MSVFDKEEEMLFWNMKLMYLEMKSCEFHKKKYETDCII
jgi:hypothetical protein